MSKINSGNNGNVPIVSSSHLASEKSMRLSEFEYALTMVNNAFNRWMLSSSQACELENMSPLDILVMHNIHHRDRAKRITDIAFTLNIDDTHNVSYSVRKLAKKGFVNHQRKGKDTYYSVTEQGKEFCLEYAKIREECLVKALEQLNLDESLEYIAKTMRTLSGFYDQASRAARSL
ncbi:MAG: winged helix DNA-binding protein [Psychromonas sp.]